MTDACIAICTCDRHAMLRDLLSALATPRYRGVPIVIVDNGAAPAQEVAEAFRPALDIRYERLAEAGLSPVRNRALELAKACGTTHVALIDDDEYPTEGWLDALLAKADAADIVYGPVYPHYLETPPKWVEQSGIFVHTGICHRTSNALLNLSLFPEDGRAWFRPEFSTIGGEDFELLQRLEKGGARVAVAEDALVYEYIHPARTTLRFVARSGLRVGVVDAMLAVLKHRSFSARLFAGGGAAASKFAYALNHAFWGVLGEPWRFYIMVRDLASVAGVIAGLAGIELHFYGRPKTVRAEERERPLSSRPRRVR